MPTTLSFLFWNIRKALGTRFYESLGRLTVRGIDVFLFAEPPDDDAKLLAALNGGPAGVYYRVPSESGRLMLFSRLPQETWREYFLGDPSGRFTAHEMKIGDHPKLLLIGAHLHAANNLNEYDRAEWARKLVADVRLIEDMVRHARTILVGDLNMNPFDRGFVDTTALHATMSRSLTRLVQRLKHRRDHPPFTTRCGHFWATGLARISRPDALVVPTSTPIRKRWEVTSGRCSTRCSSVLL